MNVILSNFSSGHVLMFLQSSSGCNPTTDAVGGAGERTEVSCGWSGVVEMLLFWCIRVMSG